MRWLVLAMTAALALSSCGGGEDDSADPDGTTTPSATPTSVSPSPSPAESPSSAGPDEVTTTLSGSDLKDPKVATVKEFWTGLTASVPARHLTSAARSLSTRSLQRDLATEIDDAVQKDWSLPPQSVGIVTDTRGSKSAGNVTVCFWSPSVSWTHATSGKYVEKERKRWLKKNFDLDNGKVSAFSTVGTCDREAP